VGIILFVRLLHLSFRFNLLACLNDLHVRLVSVETGSGSAVRRKNLVVGLMRSCREMEMKFVVRTLVR